jgi:hypothetical protein
MRGNGLADLEPGPQMDHGQNVAVVHDPAVIQFAHTRIFGKVGILEQSVDDRIDLGAIQVINPAEVGEHPRAGLPLVVAVRLAQLEVVVAFAAELPSAYSCIHDARNSI